MRTIPFRFRHNTSQMSFPSYHLKYSNESSKIEIMDASSVPATNRFKNVFLFFFDTFADPSMLSSQYDYNFFVCSLFIKFVS